VQIFDSAMPIAKIVVGDVGLEPTTTSVMSAELYQLS
jgi:uncharacterized protein with PhoU and TrkA domain